MIENNLIIFTAGNISLPPRTVTIVGAKIFILVIMQSANCIKTFWGIDDGFCNTHVINAIQGFMNFKMADL